MIRVSFDAMEKTRWKKSSSAVLNRSAMTGAKSQVTRLNRAVHTGVDKEGPGAQPPNGQAKKELTLCLHLKDDISVTDILKNTKNNLKLSALFLQN